MLVGRPSQQTDFSRRPYAPTIPTEGCCSPRATIRSRHSGKNPVVGVHNLAVAARRRHPAERDVMVHLGVDESLVVEDSDSGILGRVGTRDLECRIRAAVVSDDVLEVGIGLGEHALDAFGKRLGAIVDRRDDTDERPAPVNHDEWRPFPIPGKRPVARGAPRFEVIGARTPSALLIGRLPSAAGLAGEPEPPPEASSLFLVSCAPRKSPPRSERAQGSSRAAAKPGRAGSRR